MEHFFKGQPVLRRFVAVEGPDGAGTSTQSMLLAEGLRQRGFEACLTSEPTDGAVGQIIRRVMRREVAFSAEPTVTDRHLAYLFAADRHEHLYCEPDGIVPRVGRGEIVVSTRYFFSSYAYNARTPEGLELVHRLNGRFPLPEVVVFLECRPEVSMARIEGREIREIYEQESELRRVNDAFARLLEPLGDRVVRANAEGDCRAVAAAILSGVCERLARQ